MPLLRSFCCNQTTRDGTIICGVYTVVLSVLLAMLSVEMTLNLENIENILSSWGINLDVNQNRNLSLFLLVKSLGFTVSSPFLVYGGINNSRTFFLPWMFWMGFNTLANLVVLAFIILSTSNKMELIQVIIVLVVAFSACNIYCFLCVLSQYQILRTDVTQLRSAI
ncbi:uncharacterized protein LOC143245042 [Tachypleus tridentatus]|uniref:uncharacterized protein LOC143245042 n=1 Tax=Tachypleus tridentatus TaxID=6853 RepID=UPI003FCFAA4D